MFRRHTFERIDNDRVGAWSAGGANEHWNPEAGSVWLNRAREQWKSNLWINPIPEKYWSYTQSITMIQEIFGQDAMVPMTLEGLSRGMKTLTR